MGLDVWFREDVARILASTQEAMRAVTGATVPLDPEIAVVYTQGFADALQAIGVAFGVVAPDERALGPGAHEAPIVDGRIGCRGPVGQVRIDRNDGWPG